MEFSMGQVLTVVSSIMGSGALAAILSLVVSRIQSRNGLERYQIWSNEIDELTKLAEVGASGSDQSVRDISATYLRVAQAEIAQQVARRVVPSMAFQGFIIISGAIFVGIVGIAAIASGLVVNGFLELIGFGGLILAYFAGVSGQDLARSAIIDSISGDGEKILAHNYLDKQGGWWKKFGRGMLSPGVEKTVKTILYEVLR